MPANGFLPWATGVGANVLSDADYTVNDALPQGAQRGTVPSKLYNKILRQSTIISSVIGQFIVARANVDANDSQSVALLKTNFEAALAAYIGSVATPGVIVVTSQTLWVRLDGNDANDGSGNDAAHAFATVSAALAASRKYQTTGNPVVIRLGQTNTSSSPYALPGVVNLFGRSVQILGDAGAQGSYFLAGAGSSSPYNTAPLVVLNGQMTLTGLTIINTGSVSDTVQASTYGSIVIDHVTFKCAGASNFFHLGVYSGNVFLNDGVIFASPMGGWAYLIQGTLGINASGTLTFQGTPAWSVAGLYVGSLSLAGLGGTGAPAIVGSATGVRFILDKNSIINVNGAGVNYFPGNSAGTTGTGCIYG